jgi:hypothetical protein
LVLACRLPRLERSGLEASGAMFQSAQRQFACQRFVRALHLLGGWFSGPRGEGMVQMGYTGLGFLRFVLGSFFLDHLLSTIWPGSFWVRFGFVFTTGAILKDLLGSFLGSFGFVLWPDALFSTTSRVRF